MADGGVGMTLGDFGTIVAFSFSAYTFWVGSKRWFRSKKSEEIKTARELMDRISTKQDRLDEYMERVKEDAAAYDSRKHLDLMNNVLEEIEYYGLLIKNDIVEESELLKHDRKRTYMIWREINIAGKDLQSKNKLKGRAVNRFDELLASIIKYWGPQDKEEEKKSE